MKNWFKLLKISIYKCSARLCGVLCVIFIFMIGACCFLQWTKPQYEKFYFNNFVVMEPNNLNKREKIYIDRLIAKNRIIPIDEIYGKTLSYYDSLISVLTIFIAVLTTLLGLLAFTSWFSLKAKVKNDVQEIKHGLKGEIDTEIQKVVSSEFYKTWLTTEVFGKYIAENKDKLFTACSLVCQATEAQIQLLCIDKLYDTKGRDYYEFAFIEQLKSLPINPHWQEKTLQRMHYYNCERFYNGKGKNTADFNSYDKNWYRSFANSIKDLSKIPEII